MKLRILKPACAVILSIFFVHNAFSLPIEKIDLPEGFSIEIWQNKVPGARSMAWGDNNVLYVGTRQEGNVYAISDGKLYTIASDLEMPNGVAFRDGSLYVAEIHRILRFPKITETFKKSPKFEVVYKGLPDERAHGWKYIAFGPDGWLYVPIGAPCNICEPAPPFASLTRMKPDGSKFEIIAKGIRNTVGFDWSPTDGHLWFTDNGRDHLGDNRPPDELNKVTEVGQDFGYPYCHGKSVSDPKFGKKKPCSELRAAELELGPHVAALGMKFYEGKQFPKKYRGQIFIAEHGSWNRSKKVGYRISLVQVENGRAKSYEPFAKGWLQGQDVWGRPVDVLEMPDGSMLVSDDYAGVIYRITYKSGASNDA